MPRYPILVLIIEAPFITKPDYSDSGLHIGFGQTLFIAQATAEILEPLNP